MLMKMTGILTTVLVLQGGAMGGKKMLDFFSNLAKATVTRHEVNTISRMIYMEYMIMNNRVPRKSQSGWADFIRSQTRSASKDRDKSEDTWGTPFEVRITTPYGEETDTYEVRSAGADGLHDTEDDIVAESY